MTSNYYEIKVPHLNANEDEVKIVEINFNDYEYININQNVCSIESSKITEEIINESPGYIKYIKHLDEFVKTDEVIAIISENLEYLKSLNSESSEKSSINFTKKAEKLIKEKSIDINNFLNFDRIIKEKDVNDFIKKNQNKTSNNKINEDINKINSIQKEVAKNVKLSQDTNATSYMTLDLDRKIVEEICNNKSSISKLPLTLFDLLSFKISISINKFPLVNSYLEKDNIIMNKNVNLGFTVEKDNNLFMPVIKNIDNKNENEIFLKKLELIRKVYNKDIKSEDISNGTISIANISSGFIKYHYPIIYPKQSTIIGISSLEKSNTNLIKDNLIGITIGYDHRLINGNYCSSFIEFLIKEIEN